MAVSYIVLFLGVVTRGVPIRIELGTAFGPVTGMGGLYSNSAADNLTTLRAEQMHCKLLLKSQIVKIFILLFLC